MSLPIAFKPEDFRPYKKEFRGVIVAAEYSEEPFGIKGAPEVEAAQVQRYGRPVKKLGIKIITEQYEKPQYEWLIPSNKMNTRWHWFIEALYKTGAMRDVKIEGVTDEEKMQSFAKSLIGMEFYWVEETRKALGGRETDVLLPVAYFGKKKVGEEVTEVKL